MYKVIGNYYSSDHYEFTLVFEEDDKENIKVVSNDKPFIFYLEELLNRHYSKEFKMSLLSN